MCNAIRNEKLPPLFIHKYEVNEEMISNTLKAKDYWLAMNFNSYQAELRYEKKTSFPNIEEALTI